MIVKIIYYLFCFYLVIGIIDFYMIMFDGFEYIFNGYGEYCVF